MSGMENNYTEEAQILHLPVPRELTPHQVQHWEQQLEAAERAREYALRMLGRLPLELGLTEEHQS